MAQFKHSRGKWQEAEYNQLLASIGRIAGNDFDSGWIPAVLVVRHKLAFLPNRALAFESDDPRGMDYSTLAVTNVNKDTVVLVPTKAYIRVQCNL